MKNIFANEKLLFAAIGTNGFLQWFRHLIVKIQPELTALLTVLQIAIAVLTLWHLGRKFLVHKKKNEKTPD